MQKRRLEANSSSQLMPGFTLRDYQRAAADEAEQRNLLVVLPTNSGKTVIAAEVICRALVHEPTKKAVFLAPKGSLVLQQARLLLRHVGPLHLRSDERSSERNDDPRWRLGVSFGVCLDETGSGGLDVIHWSRIFDECQCAVMTPTLFEKALCHRCGVCMEDVCVLVLDEAHNLRGRSSYFSIMRYFYDPV